MHARAYERPLPLGEQVVAVEEPVPGRMRCVVLLEPHEAEELAKDLLSVAEQVRAHNAAARTMGVMRP
jgi:hypothetical protein